MREILNFFIRNSKWFVFAIYLIVSVILLVNSNPVHRSIYLTSANAVTSTVYEWAGNVTGYINLRDNNEELNRRNAELQAQVEMLKAETLFLREKILEESIVLPESLRNYSFIVAHVIKNSVTRPNNFMTINKGSLDGVAPEMGVINQNGVVGVVNVTGDHSARIISLLNPDFRLSCKIKGNDSFGSLVWDGEDPRYALLEELPRHTVYQPGDTIVTSGYSAVFPPDIPVGVIEKGDKYGTDNLFSLKVRLLTDFATLDNVQVVVNSMAEELQRLEPSAEIEK